jgi:glycerol-3-phosphate acyltransferase PlsY
MIIDILYCLVGLFGGYSIGSVPFGLLLTKIAGLGDIRAIGSGNIGATNVLRTGRKDLAFLTLVLDGGKGALAVIIFTLLSPYAALGAAIGSVAGHLFPVWLKFKGGKGVATTLGVLLALTPIAGILTCATWLIVAQMSRMSSLAAIIALIASPIYVGMVYSDIHALVAVFIAVLIIYKHRENIQRLMVGTEPKIGQKQ